MGIVSRRFRSVTSENPCIGCGKADWCAVSSDGSTFHCRRQAIGATETKSDKNGAPYYVFKVEGATPDRTGKFERPAQKPDRADADTLHSVYSALLRLLTLNDDHRAALNQRGLPDSTIDRNEYRSLPGPGRSRIAKKLHEQFGDKLLSVPGLFVKTGNKGDYLTLAGPEGLIVPVRDIEGRIVALKVRREDAKDGEGKYVYMSSAKHGGPSPGSPVHFPLGTPKTAKVVRLTEGELKADVATELDELPTISVPGVGIWRPAFEALRALGCLIVRLAIDGDANENPHVARALAACFEGLTAAGFTVEVERWDKAQGKGIDDLLANGGKSEVHADAGAAVAQTLEDAGAGAESESPQSTIAGYYYRDNSTFREFLRNDNVIEVQLCNFVAMIVEECVYDDGAETAIRFALEGKLANGSILPRVTVGSSDFASMSWVVGFWGTRAVVYAGSSIKDHLRTAIQVLSNGAPRRTVYSHMGWRQHDGQWVYLYNGGAIGPDGPVEVAVELPTELSRYCLPAPVEGDELTKAVRASLKLLELGPDRLTVPLLAAIYRAVLGGADFSLFLAGRSGTYKTEIAALVEQHFGPDLDARHLPASWSSTENALELLAFVAKDALLTIDDFCPIGSSADVQAYHRKADRVFRGQGNSSGRQRMRSDLALRPAKPPRGLILSTGEDIPRGQSLKARLLTLEVSPGDFGPQPPIPNAQLTACQQDADAGLYAQSMVGYLQWIAPQYDAIVARLRLDRDQLRDQLRGKDQHARTSTMLADLALGLRYFLDFARHVNAIDDIEQTTLWNRGLAALNDAGARQAEHITASEPAELFLRLLSSVIASGRGHIAGPFGTYPPEPHKWGWREREIGAGDNVRLEWQPQGRRVGWVEDDNLYIDSDAAFAECQNLAKDQGDSLTVTVRTVRKRLYERGYLESVEKHSGRETLTVRRTLEGRRREVLHLRIDLLSAPDEPDQPDQ